MKDMTKPNRGPVNDKVAVVTGAGSGIGRALALALSDRGARLACSDIDPAGLDETVRRIEAAGGTAIGNLVDVTDRAAMEKYAGSVAEHFGVVHQIYNNAGIAIARPVLESEWQDYERVFAVNLWGVIHGTKAFLPHLIASGAGHVVNISSLNGYMAQDGLSHYCTAKFAVRGFTETLRIEMLQAGHPVGVTVVHPGGVRTSIADNAAALGRRLGHVLTPEEEARRQTYNEKLLRMPADAAARVIVDGVEAGKGRVLVGNDARLIDAMVRLAPARYPRLAAFVGRRLN